MTDSMDDLRQASADVSGVAVLSPAALNVWDKFCGIVEDHGPPRLALAAALRAAADAVTPAPLDLKPGASFALKAIHWERKTNREQLLAIAAELEQQ